MPRVSLLSLSVIVVSLLLASSAILLWVWIVRRRRDEALRSHGKPALIMPTTSSPDVPRAPLVRDAQPQRRSPITALAVAERLTPADYEVAAGSPVDSLATMTTGETVVGDAVSEVIQGHSLRFHRPSDRSLHFLPGMLQVIEGADAGLELRFVRLSATEEPVVTFGRSEGPPYRHVQLLEPTVSRMHARLVFEDEAWHLTSLSRTNPVLVNRTALVNEEAMRLGDGDRIEMGALAFRYHSR
ncbi:MAG: FHA domain-containing protein [Gemmatimonadaceae bacterium]